MERGAHRPACPPGQAHIDMSRRRKLEHHRHNLAEIRDIMNSMKTLAYMESRKLGRFLDAQHAVVRNIEAVAADFAGFHPETLPGGEETVPVYLLLGTERGFCGDFNHELLAFLETILSEQTARNPRLIAVGHKLHTLLENDVRVAALLEGASVVEEISVLVNQVVDELAALQQAHEVPGVYCLCNRGEAGIIMQQLLPPFRDLPHSAPRFPHPPLLNRPPRDFLLGLAEHYLFAALHELLYTSLMVENQHRMKHLEGAVKHLDDRSAELTRQCNALRQEEIIEEIEVILLSAASLDGDSARHADGDSGARPEDRHHHRP
jgi:F-type H+-transporting ATPase subunit gamma